MTAAAYRTQSRNLNRVRVDTPPAARKTFLRYPTTAMERWLLMATIVCLPLQDHIPNVAGFSIMYLLFAMLAAYVFLNRLRALARIWLHPVFLAAYILIAVGILVEFSHPYTSYSEIFRFALVIVGAIFIASVCRDKQALRAGIYGYLIAGVWMSILLFLTSYGALSGAAAADFNEASQVRAGMSTAIPLHANLNGMAFITAQGATLALALALATRQPRTRKLFLGIGLFCLLATFLPMSRSGILIAGISCAAVMFVHGVNVRVIMAAIVLGLGILMWVPDVVFSRLAFSTEAREGKVEGRARVYTAAVEHFPEYMLTGVGVGNFWGVWGMHSKFASGHGVLGAHNVFIQVIIYWGLIGIGAFLAVIWQAYRCLPKQCGNDTEALCLPGIAISLLLLMLVMHNLYAKEFSLGLGLLVGARHWLWPHGVAQSA